MKKIVCVLVLLSVSICFVSCGNNFTEKYADYECVDANLTYIKAGKEIGRDAPGSWYTFSYHPIKDVSDDDFIVVDKSELMIASNETFIYQNPELKIDVLRDWTISEIQFYIKSINSSTDFQRNNEQEIIFSSNNDNAFASFLECIDSDSTSGIRTALIKDKQLYMRVLFEEEEYMAWDAEICVLKASYAIVCRLLEGGVEYREIPQISTLGSLIDEMIAEELFEPYVEL